jgi:hypothetical protein
MNALALKSVVLFPVVKLILEAVADFFLNDMQIVCASIFEQHPSPFL